MTENIAGHRNVLVEKDVSISHLYVGPFGGRHVIDCMAKLGPDALVISTDGYLPNLSGEELDKVGFPIFIPTEAVWGDGRPTFLAKIEAAEEYGVVGLNVYPDQKWGVQRGLERIIDTEETQEAVIERAKEVFAQPDFYDRQPFLEMMINPQLKQLADAIPNDGKPIIIDCGHIDAANNYPTNEDQIALEEGVVLLKYLNTLGHKDVKLSILFNEMYLLDQTGSRKTGRKVIKSLRGQTKRHGTHSFLERSYRNILKGYGFTPSLKNTLCGFEGSLAMETRQELDSYRNGDSPFETELTERGKGYSVDGDVERLVSTPESGAPGCPILAAKHNQRIAKMDPSRIVYLMNKEWEPGVVSGDDVAKKLYGTELKIDAFFYETGERNRIGITEHLQL